MTSDSSKLLMLGLRGSGKTTFLAALWHYLEANEIEDRLSLPFLQPDREYLNSIRDSWLSLKTMDRTSMRSTAHVTLSLKDKLRGANVELSVPDLSGESFHLQWSTRKALSSYVSYARQCTGAFLFIHPAEVKRTHVIRPANDEVQLDVGPSSSSVGPSPNWDPARSSTQVQLVELLQLLMGLRELNTKMRLAVVISAWDLIRSSIPPAVWLDNKMPLLSQYIRGNSDTLTSEVFGISAQGGELPADRASLMRQSIPAERCRAVRGNSLEPVRITSSLQFLLDA